MSKINKLNSGSILSAYAKEFTQKKIILDVNGKNYEVLIDEKFRTTKLQKMILEAVENFKNLEQYNETTKISYYMYLMVKHFTDISIPKIEDFAEEIRLLTALIDLEILTSIVNAFNESELKKANEFILKFNEKIKESSAQNKSGDEVKEIIQSEFDKLAGEEDATV